jgi:hypothetical protein
VWQAGFSIFGVGATPVKNMRDERPGYRYGGDVSPNIGMPLLDCSMPRLRRIGLAGAIAAANMQNRMCGQSTIRISQIPLLIMPQLLGNEHDAR